MITRAMYEASAAYLQERLNGFAPECLIVLGSGLGGLADALAAPVYIPYAEVPHMRASTAPGHAGRFAAGGLAGRRTLIMQGRLHVYEGYTPEETAYPIRLARLLGAGACVITCAAGGVNTAYRPGDLALITDTINFTHTSPMVGFDAAGFDQRFFDMSYTFNAAYRALARRVAADMGIALREGVYFYMPGPQFETPAEIRAIRALGGDMVGMSCVHEAVMARRCGMETLGIALVSNMAAGVLDQPVTQQEVLDEGAKAAARFARLLTACVAEIKV